MKQKNKKQVSTCLGQHVILDLYNCKNADADWDQLEKIFSEALCLGNFTVLTNHHHSFEPHGVSGVFVLAESHTSFHIWMELNYVSLDVYWCGKSCDIQKFSNHIIDFFAPESLDYKYLDRGFF